ncbi:FCD domain-containing protein [Petroclostridium sp. X23]|uniref:FadR/GntR family transcriptional regulator n=1 Tax=Petroclostridium sp. X23 TaxID=3045146 RepID=UPI0024AC9B95|nr:FCD domain-containing protein [Petroclostridium sp. X23]WHH58011.1 FCD domain-containing protein [Petroclostridium sp. X23]
MKPIEMISIVEQVIDNLKDYIVDNKISEGDKMPTEKQICEMYGVGRSTAREAYRMMLAMGMLEVKRGKGAYFKGFPNEQADDNYVANWFKEHGQRLRDYAEVRIAIETMTTKLAILRMNDRQLDELKVIHRLFVQSAEMKNHVKMALYDEEFHNKITEASENELLIKIVKIIAECIVDYRIQTYNIRENVQHAIESHDKLLKAFEDRDPDSGIQLMTEHLENSLIDMEKIITKN